MSKENRFEGLMGAVGTRKNAQTSETKKPSNKKIDVEASKNPDNQTSNNLNVQTSKAKSANPDYTRTTIYLPKKMHKKLKAIAVEEEREMSQIVEELIEAWLYS